MEMFFVFMGLLTIVNGKTDVKLYLWFNGHRDGENCPSVLNVIDVTAVSLTTCAKRCEFEPSCVSFFYRLTDGTCSGCTQIFDVNSGGLPQLQDSRYYCETAGWFYFSSSRYILVKAGGPFSEEEEICVNLGGHLVNVGSEEENEFLVSLLDNHTDILAIRLGLTDRQTEGDFRWVGDDTVAIYTAWEPINEPEDIDDDFDCVYMETGGLWLTNYCHSQIAFVCEAN